MKVFVKERNQEEESGLAALALVLAPLPQLLAQELVLTDGVVRTNCRRDVFLRQLSPLDT